MAFRSQLRFYFRTSRFYGLLALAVAVSAIIVTVTLYVGKAQVTAANPDADLYLGAVVQFVSTLAVLNAALFGGDAIATDFGTSTGYYTLVLPVRRFVLLAGRFAAAFLPCFLIVVAFYGIVGGGAFYLYGSLPVQLIESLLFAGVYTLAILALAFAFSSMFRSPAIGIVVTVLLILFVLPILEFALVAELRIEPWFSLSYAGLIVTEVFAKNVAHVSTGGLVYQPYLWEGVLIMLGYLIGSFSVAALVYRYRELKG